MGVIQFTDVSLWLCIAYGRQGALAELRLMKIIPDLIAKASVEIFSPLLGRVLSQII